MSLYPLLLEPFIEFGFMRRALVACVAIGLGGGPVGVLLVLRRMSLVGDAMAHAVMPGIAIGFLISGFSLTVMSVSGFIAGLIVAACAGLISRATPQREDASFAGFYLLAMALGVLIVSSRGNHLDVMHMLLGNILAVDAPALLYLAGSASVTLVLLALIYRPLLVECFDPGFLRAVGARGGRYHFAFLLLVVLNLVAGFHALGTLMAVGLMMLPAVSGRFWAASVPGQMAAAAALAVLAGYLGLLVSYHQELASGPCIVLAAGGLYLFSLLAGRWDSVRSRLMSARHLEA